MLLAYICTGGQLFPFEPLQSTNPFCTLPRSKYTRLLVKLNCSTPEVGGAQPSCLVPSRPKARMLLTMVLVVPGVCGPQVSATVAEEMRYTRLFCTSMLAVSLSM